MTVDPLRSSIMKAVKSRNTQPEMMVRRMIHAMGKRYRLHREDLPGKPDLTFPRLRKIIFVHGCFWHGHDCKRGAREPKTNVDYWRNKIARNRFRDEDNRKKLNDLGWEVLAIWECELKNTERLAEIIKVFLDA
ncbi:MAG: very short patch repair endonuclease [Methylococcaceae bacterium]